MDIKFIEIFANGIKYYPHTDAKIVKFGASNVFEQINSLSKKIDSIKIPDASLSEKGIVKLNDTTNSTSTTESATANSVRITMNKAMDAMKKAEEAFQSASNGKPLIASAITGKGINANGDETYSSLANKIKQITTGIDTTDATANSGDLIEGKFAYAKGNKINGTIPNRGKCQVSKNQYVWTDYLVSWVPGGYYNPWQKANDGSMCSETWTPLSGVASAIGLTSDKILSGNNICGINGTGVSISNSDKNNIVTILNNNNINTNSDEDLSSLINKLIQISNKPISIYKTNYKNFTDNIETIALDKNKYIYIGGRIGMIIKLDSQFNEIWRFNYENRIGDIQIDNTDNIYFFDRSKNKLVKMDSNRNILFEITEYVKCFCIDNNKCIYISTFSYVVKYDINGKEIWRLNIIDKWSDLSKLLVNNDILYEMYSNGTCTIRKINPNNKQIISNIKSIDSTKYIVSMAVDSNDYIYYTTTKGNIIKVDSNGKVIWDILINQDDYSIKVIVDSYNNIYTRSNKGIIKINTNGKILYEYSIKDVTDFICYYKNQILISTYNKDIQKLFEYKEV